MKKAIALAAASILCFGALTACSSSEPTSTETESSTETATESAADSSSSSSETTSETSSETTKAVEAVETQTVYVTADWLNSALEGDQTGYEDLFVAEVVYSEEALADTYDKGHIPGASFVYDIEVEDAEGTVDEPYNLLPAEEVEANMLAHGITKETKVVLYGSDISGTARVAYAYLWAGVEDVKILNGGLNAWEEAGFSTDADTVTEIAATDFGAVVPVHADYWTSMDEAKEKVSTDDTFKLVSIRSEAEWLGKTSGYSYIDRAGEPEGAVWGKGAQSASDVADFTNSDGTVKDLEGILEVWEDCDFTLDDHLAFYCGTGWRACVPFLVLYENGYRDISLYDGGWYEWQMYDDNPVQVGDPDSDDCEYTTVSELPTDMAAAA